MTTTSARSAALLVVHGEGRCAEVLASLRRRYRGDTRLALFTPDLDAHTGELEAFMADVGTGDFGLVHVIPGVGGADSDANAVISERPDPEVVTRVADVDALFRRRFPALAKVDTWVALDVGRAWDPAAREVVAKVAEIAGGARVRRVFAVSGSTDLTVAPRPDDRSGMLADLAWNLALSNLGQAPGVDAAWVWAVGSQSFTFDGVAWNLLGTSSSVAKAIEDRPLAPSSPGIQETATSDGQRWVRECQLGTEAERRVLTASGRGDGMDWLTVDVESIRRTAPDDWALAIEREFIRLCGAPLAAFTRVVEGNAASRLVGRERDPESGLLDRFDRKLTGVLQDKSGCQRSGLFVFGVAESLQEAAQHVADVPHPDPKSFDLDEARADLDRAMASLPEVRPWLVRTGLLAMAAVALLAGAGFVVVAAAPAAAVLLAGVWGLILRRRVVRGRDRYAQLVEAKVQAIAWERLLAAQLALVKDLQSHVGSYFDAGGRPTTMEVSVGPPVGTRAEDVKRIWKDLVRLADEFQDHSRVLQAWQPLPACGKFFHAFPGSQEDAETAFSRDSDEFETLRREVLRAVDEVLATIELDWDYDELRNRIVAASDSVAQPGLALHQLVSVAPVAEAEAVEALSRTNTPHLDIQLVPHVAKFVVGPASGLPAAFQSLVTSDAADAPVAALTTADARRVSTIWLRPQDFERPVDAPQEVDDGSGQSEREVGPEESNRHKGSGGDMPGPGLVAGGGV